MARGDRTGPEGRGPLTGRGMGFCADNKEPGYTAGGGFFRGGGRGFFGRGRGRGFYNAQPVDEKTYLEEEKNYLEQRLAGIKTRLGEKE